MNNNFEKIIENAKKESLTARERSVLSESIQDFVRSNPIPGVRPTFSFYAWGFSFRKYPVAALVAILFFVGGAGSALAEKSLPGEALYGLKTGVNEKVLGWLATTPNARAEWQLSLADRRLSEIEQLSAEQKLSPELHASLKKSIDVSANLALSEFAAGDQPTIAVTSESKGGDETAKQNIRAKATMMSTLSAPDAGSDLGQTPQSGAMSATATVAAVSTSTVSVDDINGLRNKLMAQKASIETDREKLRKQHRFITEKGNTIIAGQALFDASQALEEGNDALAHQLYNQAEVLISKAKDGDISPSLEN